ncbi:MAG: histidinol dehydrogenase [Firmicutes bacterium]|nr:histidinol dehydrogenase [Bacillota bacterium]
MIKTFDLNTMTLEEILDRTEEETVDVTDIVVGIIDTVRQKGDQALLEYAKKFDQADLNNLVVTQEEIDEALARIDTYFIETLKQARDNIQLYHEKQLRTGYELQKEDGIVLGQKVTPLARVGVYVPGGTASYPSSVLMNVIPAKIAGVGEIVMVTPPDKNGKVAAPILAAASVAGVTKIVKTGGAQAVAALAYGTESVPKVDKIVGPGNAFVATAKRMVFGQVDIDMIAGPSEILVLADGTCNPSFVAADLLSQAEHDKMAQAVLVTDSAELAAKVADELEVQLSQLPREEIARTSIENRGKIIVAGSLEQAIEAANAIAPEHLELCVDEPFDLLPLVKNAGSIFLGKHTPEAMGDYFAGTNHILPTGGTARFSSPLSVDDFVKKSSYLYYTPEALVKVKDRVADFAEREGLHAHGKSVTIRFEE